MDNLSNKKCEACRVDAPKVDSDQALRLLSQIPGWNIVTEEGMSRLKRVYAFPNFEKALAFAIKIGALAEAENHHPAILTEWGKVTVAWWTHKIKGLHMNDFIMAAKTDRLQ